MKRLLWLMLFVPAFAWAQIDYSKNFVKVNVGNDYDADDVTVIVATGSGSELPDPATYGAYNVVWWNASTYGDPSDDPNVEIVRVTARSGDTLTVTRAQEGTSGTAKNTNGKTYRMILAATANWFNTVRDSLWYLEG